MKSPALNPTCHSLRKSSNSILKPGELRRHGLKIKLEPQASKNLVAAAAGNIRERIWRAEQELQQTACGRTILSFELRA